jgi:hypothetical protein
MEAKQGSDCGFRIAEQKSEVRGQRPEEFLLEDCEEQGAERGLL